MTERQNAGLQDEELVSVFNLWFDQFVSKPTSIFGITTQFLFGVNGGKVAAPVCRQKKNFSQNQC